MLHIKTVGPATLGLIHSINSFKPLSDFHLVGGTALALRFGHRLSIDLDYFSTQPFEPEVVQALIQDWDQFQFVSKNPIGLFVYLRKIKVDFVKHPFTLLSPIETVDGIRMFSLDDIGAMKIAAISGRAEKKDFFDLFYLCHHHKPLRELLMLFVQKYKATSLFIAA